MVSNLLPCSASSADREPVHSATWCCRSASHQKENLQCRKHKRGWRDAVHLSNRKEKLASLISAIYSDKGTEEYDDMRWMRERQFKAHMKVFEDMSAVEAQQESDKAMIATDAEKHAKKGRTQVAVSTGEGFKHYRRKGSSKVYEQEEELIEASADMEEGRKWLRIHVENDENAEIYHSGLTALNKAIVAPPIARPSNSAKTVPRCENLEGYVVGMLAEKESQQCFPAKIDSICLNVFLV